MINVIISLNVIVMHVTKIILFFLNQTRHADCYHRYYNHGEMYLEYKLLKLKRTSVFIQRTRDNTYILSSLFNVDHA